MQTFSFIKYFPFQVLALSQNSTCSYKILVHYDCQKILFCFFYIFFPFILKLKISSSPGTCSEDHFKSTDAGQILCYFLVVK